MAGRKGPTASRPELGAVGRHGAASGLLSGLVFSVAASLAAVLQGKSWEGPIRLVAAVALGPSVLDPGAPLLSVLAWGMGLHLLFAVVTGGIFAWLVAASPWLRGSAGRSLFGAMGYALALYLAHFYVVSPVLGWWWFPERTDFLVQLLLQVIFCGAPLGAYFAPGRVRGQLTSAVPQRGDEMVTVPAARGGREARWAGK